MIELEYATEEVRRLSQLAEYPRYAPQAEADLFRVAALNAESLEQLSTVITRIIDEQTTCPKPSELKLLLRPILTTPQFVPSVSRDCPHGRCDGSGYERVFYLWTQEGRGQARYVKKERITEEQYHQLWKQIDTRRGNQTLHEGVNPCACRADFQIRAAGEAE